MKTDCNNTPQNCADCTPSSAPVLAPQNTSTPCPEPNPCAKITRAVCVKQDVLSVASQATITPTSEKSLVSVTALATNAVIAQPTGLFNDGHKYIFRIKDNGTARLLSFNNIYRAVGVTLPTTTVANKILYIECYYNKVDLKFDVINVRQEV